MHSVDHGVPHKHCPLLPDCNGVQQQHQHQQQQQSNLFFRCLSAAAAGALKNAFVIVQISRFQQIIGVFTLQAPNEALKVRVKAAVKARSVFCLSTIAIGHVSAAEGKARWRIECFPARLFHSRRSKVRQSKVKGQTVSWFQMSSVLEFMYSVVIGQGQRLQVIYDMYRRTHIQ